MLRLLAAAIAVAATSLPVATSQTRFDNLPGKVFTAIRTVPGGFHVSYEQDMDDGGTQAQQAAVACGPAEAGRTQVRWRGRDDTEWHVHEVEPGSSPPANYLWGSYRLWHQFCQGTSVG